MNDLDYGELLRVLHSKWTQEAVMGTGSFIRGWVSILITLRYKGIGPPSFIMSMRYKGVVEMDPKEQYWVLGRL